MHSPMTLKILFATKYPDTSTIIFSEINNLILSNKFFFKFSKYKYSIHSFKLVINLNEVLDCFV